MVGRKAEASPDKKIFPKFGLELESQTLLITHCLSSLEWLFLEQRLYNDHLILSLHYNSIQRFPSILFLCAYLPGLKHLIAYLPRIKKSQLATRSLSREHLRLATRPEQTRSDRLSIGATLKAIQPIRPLRRNPFKNHLDLHGLLEYLWRLLVICTFTLTFRQSTIPIFPFSFTTSPPNIHVVIAIASTNFTITTAISAAAWASTAEWPRSEPGQEQGFLCDSRSGEESTGGLSDEGHG